MHLPAQPVAETSAALALALAGDARFPPFSDRVSESLGGTLGIALWIARVAPAVEEGIAKASTDVDDVDFIGTIQRVATFILDCALVEGSVARRDTLVHFASWAAHQR